MTRPPPRKRPELTFDELLQLKWLVGGVLTLLALATVAYMDVDAWILMTIGTATTIGTTLWPALPARVPRNVHVLAFPFIAAFFSVDLWWKAELLPAMVRLDILLLTYRAIVYRQRRDDLQVIVLGLFLVVVAGVLTVSLVFAAQILLYTALALVFLFLITLVDAAKPGVEPVRPAASRSDRPDWVGHSRWPTLLARVRQVTDWRVLALSSGLFAGVVALTALLFLAIPRFQLDNGMFLDRFITKKARTGFSDTIKFGDVTEILQDTSVAFHVDVSDPGQIPLTPYWRMLVLNDYADETFRLSPELRQKRFFGEKTGVWAWGVPRPRPSRATWRIYLEAGVSRYLPLLGDFYSLRFGESQNFRFAQQIALIALAKEPVTMTAYQVESFDLSERLRDRPDGYYSGWSTGRGVAAAEDAAKLRRLVREAAGPGEHSAAEFSSRVCAWLRERHLYSLSPRIPSGSGDPLVKWIDSQNPGHCELFAGAFVLLARAAGFPARVVTGFRGGTWNAFSNSFTVRYSDAHAWAEIYDAASSSWLRADPLEIPTGNGASGGGTGLANRTDRSWAARLDSLRVFWYRRIVSFDQADQVSTLKAAKQATQSAILRLRSRFDHLAVAVKNWWNTPWDVTRVARVLVLALLVGGLSWLWRRLRFSLVLATVWRGPGKRDDRIRREASRWLRRLGARSDRSETDSTVIADLQRLRFGHRRTWPDASLVFRHARVAARRRHRRTAGEK